MSLLRFFVDHLFTTRVAFPSGVFSWNIDFLDRFFFAIALTIFSFFVELRHRWDHRALFKPAQVFETYLRCALENL